MPVGTHEDEFVEGVGGKLDAAADPVVDDDRFGRHLQADDEFLAGASTAVALVRQDLAAGAGIAVRAPLRLGLLSLGVELVRRFEGAIRLSLGDQPVGGRAVEFVALRLVVGTLVVLESEPVERGKDLTRQLLARPLDVRVLDPEDVGPLLASREEEVVERRACTADVQEAGRRWRKANAGTVGVRQNAAC
jgi:hypothetical protein